MKGSAALVERFDRTVAPTKAPTAPGRPMRRTPAQSTFPKRAWDAPDAAAVPSLARWTDAEARAGVRPTARSRVVEVTPKPMPSAPSTKDAPKPARAMKMRPVMGLRHSGVRGWTLLSPVIGDNSTGQGPGPVRARPCRGVSARRPGPRSACARGRAGAPPRRRRGSPPRGSGVRRRARRRAPGGGRLPLRSSGGPRAGHRRHW